MPSNRGGKKNASRSDQGGIIDTQKGTGAQRDISLVLPFLQRSTTKRYGGAIESELVNWLNPHVTPQTILKFKNWPNGGLIERLRPHWAEVSQIT